MKVQNVSIDSIKPYENNPRDNDGGVDAVANSIKEFGWQQPIVVDNDNVIIVGHTRYKAAKKLGMDKVPVVVADNLSDEQVKAYRLADNKTSELTNWNLDLLDDELNEILDIDMEDFGFENVDDVGLPDDFFEEEDNHQQETSTQYLTWQDKRIEVDDTDVELLNEKLQEFKKGERGKSFVKFLINE